MHQFYLSASVSGSWYFARLDSPFCTGIKQNEGDKSVHSSAKLAAKSYSVKKKSASAAVGLFHLNSTRTDA